MIIANIDQPAPFSEVNDEFKVWGWIFSESGLITKAQARCGGEEFPLRLGLARPDVLQQHPETCRNEFVGFEGTLKLPPPEADAGTEVWLRVQFDFEDSEGHQHTIETELKRAPRTELSLPAPFQYGLDLPIKDAPVYHTLAVEGWVLSENPDITCAELIVDGETTELSFGWPRPDVVSYFNIQDRFVDCGFRGFVVPRNVGRLEYEVRFFAGDALVTTLQAETIVASADPVSPIGLPLPGPHLGGLAARYVDLLSKALNGSIYSDGVERSDGRDWPANAHTMLGNKRLTHLRHCVETALHDGVEGDFIETGVWKGGSCVLMRGILQAAGDTQRTVWVADSFQGLPKPAVEAHPLDEGDSLHIHQDLVIPMEQVKSTFRSYDLLDDQVAFLPGWFCDTLPKAPISKLAILRLDGDMYESTIDALNALYHKLQPGGFCIIDDYGCIAACRAAVHDFRRQHGITEPIHVIDWTGAFWRKQNPA